MLKQLLTTGAFLCGTTAAFADYTRTILHTNDFHARFEPISKYDSGCSAEANTEGKCFGGSARLVTAVTEARGQGIVFCWLEEISSKERFFTHITRASLPLK